MRERSGSFSEAPEFIRHFKDVPVDGRTVQGALTRDPTVSYGMRAVSGVIPFVPNLKKTR